ncbi:hypothetical protein M9H77_33438 [Catharanthus roseus]|uniref:Uncharacterized protein n=1 Tax=Catharanthus roseus TaxID=4058 RepID=A0ACB9ZIT3_CATRO|nr:hypothetical protein M9H77_33438 [Catharanthus roseus]
MAASCSTSYSSSVDLLDRCNLIPLSLCGSRHLRCSSSPSSSSLKNLILSRRPTASFANLRLRLLLDGSAAYRANYRIRVGTRNQRFITAVARADPDRLDDSHIKEDANTGNDIPAEENTVSDRQEKASQLRKRIVFGLGIGISAGGVVLVGGWVFTVAVAAAVFVGSREFFELVRSRGIAAGMTPPPRYVSRVCSVICSLMPILTLYLGQIDVSVTSAASIVAIALLLQRRSPRFAQLSSAMFGLFYCGYLPCFWIKLRCLAAPALNSSKNFHLILLFIVVP